MEQMLTSLRSGSHTLSRRAGCTGYVVVDGGEGGGINIGKAVTSTTGNRTIDRDMREIVANMVPEDAPFAFGEPLNASVSNDTQPGSWYA
jgi:hypothetical protein